MEGLKGGMTGRAYLATPAAGGQGVGDAVGRAVSLGAIIATAARGRAAGRDAVRGSRRGVEALLEDGRGVHQPVNPEHGCYRPWGSRVSSFLLVLSSPLREVQSLSSRAG